MKQQEIFDAASAHLMGMDGPSLDMDGDACVYRGYNDDCEFNGQKCAVGLFIADEHYSPDLEGSGMSNQLVAESVAKSWDQDVLRPDQLLLLHDLQTAHDETSRGEEWPNSIVDALDKVADKHHLRFDPKGASA
tara:strand:+ start:76 stop:477 length:402 start_codon:yes stop_codon:yes gene_type:complete